MANRMVQALHVPRMISFPGLSLEVRSGKDELE
jgi:hypothetical protein